MPMREAVRDANIRVPINTACIAMTIGRADTSISIKSAYPDASASVTAPTGASWCSRADAHIRYDTITAAIAVSRRYARAKSLAYALVTKMAATVSEALVESLNSARKRLN